MNELKTFKEFLKESEEVDVILSVRASKGTYSKLNVTFKNKTLTLSDGATVVAEITNSNLNGFSEATNVSVETSTGSHTGTLVFVNKRRATGERYKITDGGKTLLDFYLM